jgi:hypothetical protein
MNSVKKCIQQWITFQCLQGIILDLAVHAHVHIAALASGDWPSSTECNFLVLKLITEGL